MTDKPRFVIVNTVDAPSRRHVAEWVDGIGYCYMARELDHMLRRYDGMDPRRPTPIEEFGFAVAVNRNEATFVRIAPSTATYEDGKPRRWQDSNWEDKFTLPLVQGVRSPRKQARA